MQVQVQEAKCRRPGACAGGHVQEGMCRRPDVGARGRCKPYRLRMRRSCCCWGGGRGLVLVVVGIAAASVEGLRLTRKKTC